MEEEGEGEGEDGEGYQQEEGIYLTVLGEIIEEDETNDTSWY